MADGIVQLQPNSTGAKVDTSELTVGANLVERQRVNIADPVGAGAIAAVKGGSIPAAAADPALVVAVSPNTPVAAAQSGVWTVQPGNTPNTAPWLAAISGSGNIAAVKPAATPAASGDTALSVALHPSSPLPAGVNAIGTVTAVGASPSGAAKAGNPVQTGAVFNTAQPTVATGQIVEVQATSRGALMVATGVDTFNAASSQSGVWTVQPGNTANTVPWLASISAGGSTAAVKAASTPAAPSDPALVVAVSPNTAVASSQSGVWTVQPGNTANTSPWLASISAGGSTAAVKAASTSAAAGDPALVVAVSPNTAVNAAQSGVWTVQPGNTANTSPWLVNGPALTKGTQGANGLTTQDLKDAGRTAISFYAVLAASGATGVETAVTLSKAAGTAAPVSAASFVVTAAKRFRITAVSFATRGNAAATAQMTTFSLRLNTAGAVTTASNALMRWSSATPATASGWDRVSVPLPDGFEIPGDGTLQIGVTANSVFVTNAPTWDVALTGYEY